MGMSLNVLAGIGISFVVIAIVLSFGATILGQLRATQVASTYEYNATTNGLSSLNTMSSWLPTLALVVIAAIIIGIVVTYLGGRGKEA